MLGTILETAAVLDYLFEGHTCPFCSADGAFGPGRVDHLVAFAGVFYYLLETTCTTALDGDELGDAWESGFVLEVCEGEGFGVVDEPIKTKIPS